MPPELTLVAPLPKVDERVSAPPPTNVTPLRPAGHRRATRGRLLFVAFLGLYAAAGALLTFRYDMILGDAISRVANAYYVVFSRDPHLGAIGFVWSPLPSLAVLPLLPLKVLWPALVTKGFAGSLMSAAFMAGAVWQVRSIVRELGMGRWSSLAVAVCFGLHPATLYYGANGMSEAPFIFLLLTVTKMLARWVAMRELRSLAATGFALALAYLTRYEAIFAGLAVMAVVGLLTFVRTAGNRRERGEAAIADVAIVGAPFGLAFVLWSAASWLIVGHPFEQFSSSYGTASQLSLGEGVAETWRSVGKPAFLLEQQHALQPLFLLLVVVAVIVSIRRRSPLILAPAAAVGGALAFQVLAFLTGRTWGSLRYEILVVPMSALLVGIILGTARPIRPAGRMWPRRLAGTAVVGLLVAGLPTGAAALLDRRLAPDESGHLLPVVDWSEATPVERYFVHRYRTEAQIADYLDSLRLPEGSVLLDTFNGYPIVLASSRPRQFVITSDTDFKQRLGDPTVFGVRYFLVNSPEEWGADLDAVNRTYQGIYATGAGMASLEREFHSPGWRLYRLHDGRPAG